MKTFLVCLEGGAAGLRGLEVCLPFHLQMLLSVPKAKATQMARDVFDQNRLRLSVPKMYCTLLSAWQASEIPKLDFRRV